MTKILAAVVFAVGFSAAAAEIKITSWGPINPKDYDTHAGEVCGKITGGDGTEKILILADPGKHQGEYIAFPSPTGNFCMIVGTYNGKVDVSIAGAKSASASF